MKAKVEFAKKSKFGGFFHKLVATSTVEMPGLGTQTKKSTFYISLDKEIKVGTTVDIPMDKYSIVPVDYELEDEVIQLNRLVLKAQ